MAVARYYQSRYPLHAAILLGILFIFFFGNSYAYPLEVSDKMVNNIEQQYGPTTKARVLAWQALIKNNQNKPELVKLKLVNRFFNKLKYQSDSSQWNQENYWSTPLEFLIANKGDCEDFAIAKYFTLQAMGVPSHKMRITYVKSRKFNRAHMVLSYYEAPNTDPFIMDNLIPLILFGTERPDLVPIYSFNGDGLWLSNKPTKKARTGKGNKMVKWIDLKQRMRQEGFNMRDE